MAIPLLEYPASSQNQRVRGFEVGGEEQTAIYSTRTLEGATSVEDVIAAAYRQVFHEQQSIKQARNLPLESQLRNGQITVRDFIRGLATAPLFRERNLESNSNYRFVQICVQRLLGREIYNDRETYAWSIVLATRGLEGFINELLATDEYLDAFGDDVVPYQRRRILPQRATGEVSFEHMPRYDANHLQLLKDLGNNFEATGSASVTKWDWENPPIPTGYVKLGEVLAKGGGLLLGAGVLAVLLAYYGVIGL